MPILFSFADRRIDTIDLSIKKTETWLMHERIARKSGKLCDNQLSND